MVRPIEMSDVLSKVQVAERIQQSAKAVPEATQQFQKELNEKLAGEQVTTAQPAPPGDRIILHAEEQEKGRKKEDEERKPAGRQKRKKNPDAGDSDSDSNPPAPSGHIDIRA
ncbi:MAG: hypothetical protein ACYC9O_08245 [Candidatus Latescibacterota bacterium]